MARATWITGFAAIATLLLTGCGNSDGEQKAFVAFLQTRILDKPGMHVPQLTADERASFGHYADDYAVITDFNKTMTESVSPKLTATMSAGSISSLQDIVTRRPQLETVKSSLGAMANILRDDIARTDAAHAKLDQPAEVKPVYDKAYDRLVTQPAAAFQGIVPVMTDVLGQAIDLGGYIDAHRAAVKVSGSTVETNDPTVRSAINDRLRSLQASQQAVQSAQTKMQSVVYGKSS